MALTVTEFFYDYLIGPSIVIYAVQWVLVISWLVDSFAYEPRRSRKKSRTPK